MSSQSEGITIKQTQEAPSFGKGFLLQRLNPKSWIAYLSGISAFQVAQSLSLACIF